jgi:hypothetical protein
MNKIQWVELNLRHCLQATGTYITADATAVLVDRSPLHIGPELPLCLALREANVLTAQRSLATYFTFRHNFTLPDIRPGGTHMKGDQRVA